MVFVDLGTVTIFPDDGIIWSASNPANAGQRFLLQFEISSSEPSFVLSYFNFFFRANGHNQNNIVNTISGRYFVRNGVRQATYLDLSNSFAGVNSVEVGVQRIPLLSSISNLASAQVQAGLDTDDTIPIAF